MASVSTSVPTPKGTRDDTKTKMKETMQKIKDFGKKYWVQIAIALGVVIAISVVVSLRKHLSSSSNNIDLDNSSNSGGSGSGSSDIGLGTIEGVAIQPLYEGMNNMGGRIKGYIEVNNTNGLLAKEIGQWIWSSVLRYKCSDVAWSDKSNQRPPQELLDMVNKLNSTTYGGTGIQFSDWPSIVYPVSFLRIPVCG